MRRTRSAYYLSLHLRRALRDSPGAARASLERWYQGKRDPWKYRDTSEERERYTAALELMDLWAAGRRPGAVEIGCGEGLFTEELVPRCASVLGLDLSRVALERARERCARFDNVSFREWDARGDPSPGRFELVVCMDVMDDLLRPITQRRAIKRVTGSVADGGALLVTAVLQHPLVETAAWASWLGRGGNRIVELFGVSDRRLRRVGTRTTGNHVVVLYEAAAS